MVVQNKVLSLITYQNYRNRISNIDTTRHRPRHFVCPMGCRIGGAEVEFIPDFSISQNKLTILQNKLVIFEIKSILVFLLLSFENAL